MAAPVKVKLTNDRVADYDNIPQPQDSLDRGSNDNIIESFSWFDVLLINLREEFGRLL